MKQLQDFSKTYQKELNFHVKDSSYERCKASLLMNHMLLTTEVAEVAELLREMVNDTEKQIANGINEMDALNAAKAKVSDEIGKEISDCLAYLCKLANFFERDMESDFYNKMEEVKNRFNK
ncbi:MAG TPA: hypothetical protein DCY20_07680 [Firmicutes bacterium]|nr:hypothetical protein [Bacillota bacterium]